MRLEAVSYLVKANLSWQELSDGVGQLLEDSGHGRADEACLAGRG
jgi:hypothetical protein